MQFTKKQLIKRLEEQESAARYALSFVQDSEILRDIEMDLRITEIALASLDAGSNSHPAPVPLSNYRLYRIREILGKAAAQSDGGNIGYAMSDAVKAIDELLEARKAEPVAWTDEEELRDVRRVGFGEMFSVEPISPNADMCRVIPLYTTPPAPVTVPPEQHWEELCRQHPDMSIGDAIIRAAWWNLCRAAMLNGGKS